MRSVISPNSAILEDCSRRLENVIGLENRKLIGGVRLYPPVDDRVEEARIQNADEFAVFQLECLSCRLRWNPNSDGRWHCRRCQ